MRGEQRAGFVYVVKMFERRPSDGKAIVGRCAAPDFIEDHQRVFIRLVKDRGCFHHFNHEGRAPPREVIRGTNAAEKLTHDTNVSVARRDETTHLSKDSDKSVLTKKRRLTRHVWTREKPNRSTV